MPWTFFEVRCIGCMSTQCGRAARNSYFRATSMGALDGIRVIDFGQYIAGPLAALMLADQGADVIHVDPPRGPCWKADADAVYNRGKRRIMLDLKQPADRATAHQLIESADVVVENFRPGVMNRLGLDGRELCAALPRLIYCSIPGFASD